MMKHVRIFVGAFVVGLAIMGAWGQISNEYGTIGGWLAALFIVTPTWFVNHYCGLIHQDGAWVDQGLALGAAGMFKGLFLDGAGAFAEAVPLLAVVCVGGALGGIFADMADTNISKENGE